MGKALIIAEKPSVASDIAKALGGFTKTSDGWFESADAIISSAIGHLVGLNVPEAEAVSTLESLPMIPAQFNLEVLPRTSSQFTLLKKLMGRPDVEGVVNACDAGREGELIFRYIFNKAQCRKPMKRMWLQSMTPDSIREAHRGMRPGSEFENLYNAAQCRSEADWLVGINGSRASKLLRERQTGKRESVSAGRVMTPTLAILTHREIAICTFKPQDYWEVHAIFGAQAGQYVGRWLRSGESEGDNAHRFGDADSAKAVVQRCQGVNPSSVTDESKPVSSMPPKLFDLTTLQRECNNKFGISAKMALDIAQALYEKHKVLTYPRTDSSVLPEDYVETAKATLATFSGTRYAAHASRVLENQWVKQEKRVFDNSKISDHFAIIPNGTRPEGLSEIEAKVYDLVTCRFIAVFHPAAEYSQTTRITEVAGERFKSSGRILVKEGWLAVYGKDAGDDKTPPLCLVVPGESVTTKKVESFALQTKPPVRFTEATLLGAMESAGSVVEEDELREAMKERGLGTPATRAATIEKLLVDKDSKNSRIEPYAVRDGKQLVPTQKGMELIAFLEGNGIEALTSPKMTGEWEYKLNQMAQGHYGRERFMGEIGSMVHQIVSIIRGKVGSMPVAEVKRLEVPCPKCGGAVESRGSLFHCSGCDFKLWKEIAGRALSEKEAAQLIRDGALPVVDGFVSREKKKFSAGLKLLPEGKVEFVFPERGSAPGAARPASEEIAKCPRCKGSVRDAGRTFACDAGDFRLWKEIAGKTLTVGQAARLITQGSHPPICGFTSAKKTKFEAGLELLPDDKVKFVFESR